MEHIREGYELEGVPCVNCIQGHYQLEYAAQTFQTVNRKVVGSNSLSKSKYAQVHRQLSGVVLVKSVCSVKSDE